MNENRGKAGTGKGVALNFSSSSSSNATALRYNRSERLSIDVHLYIAKNTWRRQPPLDGLYLGVMSARRHRINIFFTQSRRILLRSAAALSFLHLGAKLTPVRKPETYSSGGGESVINNSGCRRQSLQRDDNDICSA